MLGDDMKTANGRAESMQQAWVEGAAGKDNPLSPQREDRSGLMHNLRSTFGGSSGSSQGTE